MAYLKETKHFRPSEAVLNAAEELMKKYPDDYRNFSYVVRAGIIALHKKRCSDGSIQQQ